MTESTTASEKYNFDRHIWDVRPEVLAPMSKVDIPQRGIQLVQLIDH